MEQNKDQERNKIPDYDPSKAMDSKKEVEQSNDEKTDQDFPGYPHYPAREDIMDKRTDSHRVDLDVENLPRGANTTGVDQRFVTGQDREIKESQINAPLGSGDQDIDTRTDSNSDSLNTLNSSNEEIGKRQNLSNEDLEGSR